MKNKGLARSPRVLSMSLWLDLQRLLVFVISSTPNCPPSPACQVVNPQTVVKKRRDVFSAVAKRPRIESRLALDRRNPTAIVRCGEISRRPMFFFTTLFTMHAHAHAHTHTDTQSGVDNTVIEGQETGQGQAGAGAGGQFTIKITMAADQT